MKHIYWLSSGLKARHLLIFNIDFCIEYFPQTRFWQRLVSHKTQTAPFVVLLRKISLIFYGTAQTFKLFSGTLTERLTDFDFIPLDYSMDIAVFLGLESDTFKFFLPINFWFLLVRFHIWGCRTCNLTGPLS